MKTIFNTLRPLSGTPHIDVLLAKIGAVMIALLCALLLITNFMHLDVARANALSEAQARLSNIRYMVVEQANRLFQIAESLAAHVATELEEQGSSAESIARIRADVGQRLADLGVVSDIVALDVRGEPILVLNQGAAFAAHYADSEYFRFHLRHASPREHVSRPFQTATDGPWVIAVSRRVDQADGSFGGVVVAFIDRQRFKDFYSTLKLLEHGTIGLYVADRSLLASNVAAADMHDAGILSAVLGMPVAAGGATGVTGSDADRMYAAAGARRYGLVGIVSLARSDALVAWRTANTVAVISAVIVTLLMALLGAILIYQLVARRNLESAMQENEERFRLMIDAVEDYGIYLLDKAGLVLTWNMGAERLTGFSASELLGTDGTSFCTPGDRLQGRAKRILESALARGREDNEGWRVRRDGSRFWAHATTTALFDSKGVHYGYLKVVRDITGSRQIADALEASEFRWKFALEGAGEGVWDINDQTGAIDVSQQFMTMLGYEANEAPATTLLWQSLVHPDDLGRVLAAWREHRAGRTPNYSVQYRVRCKDGSWKWVLSRGMVVSRDARGRALRALGTQNDISHLKSVEQRLHQQNSLVMDKNAQLEQVSRVKSEFLANMSHELRTPLNAVLGFTGTILMELPGPLNPEQKRQLGLVRDSGRHLLALINEILDLSKIESGVADVNLQPLRCQDLVRNVTTSLMPLALQKLIRIELDLPPGDIEIRSDVQMLKQILINLIGNAIKFTETGVVTVHLFQTAQEAPGGPDRACIAVTDTGIGICKEDMGKLFLPFSQVEAALSRRFEGTGLGLNVSKKYADLIGATLQVESTYGRGSTFSVCLPLTPAAPVQALATIPEPIEAHAEDRTS